jgi:hypothetical protein
VWSFGGALWVEYTPPNGQTVLVEVQPDGTYTKTALKWEDKPADARKVVQRPPGAPKTFVWPAIALKTALKSSRPLTRAPIKKGVHLGLLVTEEVFNTAPPKTAIMQPEEAILYYRQDDGRWESSSGKILSVSAVINGVLSGSKMKQYRVLMLKDSAGKLHSIADLVSGADLDASDLAYLSAADIAALLLTLD